MLGPRMSFPEEVLEETLFSTSLNFDLSVYECFVPLSMGADGQNSRECSGFGWKYVHMTLINTVPSAMNALLGAEGSPKDVRTINLAGERLPSKLVERIFRTLKRKQCAICMDRQRRRRIRRGHGMKRGETFAGQSVSR